MPVKNFRNMSAVIFTLAIFIFTPLAALANPDYRSGEVLVVLKNNVGQLSAAALDESSSSGYIRGVADSAGADVIRAYSSLSQSSGEIFAHLRSDTKTTDEMIAELEGNPDVIAVSPNYIVRALEQPNDPDYGRLWGMSRIGANTAWNVTTGDPGIYVAVLDSGIQQNHPDLMANADTAYSKNFTTASLWGNRNDFNDEHGHGTHVSGTIGAVGNNGVGVGGVTWRT
jgi:hypothetical protein